LEGEGGPLPNRSQEGGKKALKRKSKKAQGNFFSTMEEVVGGEKGLV